MSSVTVLISNAARSSGIIAPSRLPAARRAGEQKRQCKADGACRHQRSDRIVLHFSRERFLSFADRVAAVIVHVLGVVGGLVGGVLHRILGLAVEILRLAGHLAGTTI